MVVIRDGVNEGTDRIRALLPEPMEWGRTGQSPVHVPAK